MSIPDFQNLMLPLLKLANDGQEHASRDATDNMARLFQLTDAEREELLPAGHSLFGNRVGWALTHLRHAELLETTKRGYFRITQRGKQVLQQNPQSITTKFLMQFPEYQQFAQATRKDKSKKETNEVDLETPVTQTPHESLEDGYRKIRQNLAQELLSQVKSCSPRFFERLVVELLVEMGYGGSIKDAAKVIGRSGDEGIDGTIKEDRLGLDIIYVQAKKWEGIVGRPEIHKFVGALQGQRARKGVFITTSYFTGDAEEYARNIDNKIILIDGKQLADFMIDFNVGVSIETIYEIKKMDTDYFSEEI